MNTFYFIPLETVHPQNIQNIQNIVFHNPQNKNDQKHFPANAISFVNTNDVHHDICHFTQSMNGGNQNMMKFENQPMFQCILSDTNNKEFNPSFIHPNNDQIPSIVKNQRKRRKRKKKRKKIQNENSFNEEIMDDELNESETYFISNAPQMINDKLSDYNLLADKLLLNEKYTPDMNEIRKPWHFLYLPSEDEQIPKLTFDNTDIIGKMPSDIKTALLNALQPMIGSDINLLNMYLRGAWIGHLNHMHSYSDGLFVKLQSLIFNEEITTEEEVYEQFPELQSIPDIIQLRPPSITYDSDKESKLSSVSLYSNQAYEQLFDEKCSLQQRLKHDTCSEMNDENVQLFNTFYAYQMIRKDTQFINYDYLSSISDHQFLPDLEYTPDMKHVEKIKNEKKKHYSSNKNCNLFGFQSDIEKYSMNHNCNHINLQIPWFDRNLGAKCDTISDYKIKKECWMKQMNILRTIHDAHIPNKIIDTLINNEQIPQWLYKNDVIIDIHCGIGDQLLHMLRMFPTTTGICVQPNSLWAKYTAINFLLHGIDHRMRILINDWHSKEVMNTVINEADVILIYWFEASFKHFTQLMSNSHTQQFIREQKPGRRIISYINPVFDHSQLPPSYTLHFSGEFNEELNVPTVMYMYSLPLFISDLSIKDKTFEIFFMMENDDIITSINEVVGDDVDDINFDLDAEISMDDGYYDDFLYDDDFNYEDDDINADVSFDYSVSDIPCETIDYALHLCCGHLMYDQSFSVVLKVHHCLRSVLEEELNSVSIETIDDFVSIVNVLSIDGLDDFVWNCTRKSSKLSFDESYFDMDIELLDIPWDMNTYCSVYESIICIYILYCRQLYQDINEMTTVEFNENVGIFCCPIPKVSILS